MRVLVVNAGSSGVKLRVVEPDDTVSLREDVDAGDDARLRALLDEQDVDAVGHRVVHGGSEFTRPVRVTDDVLERIEALRALAPLHQPPAVRGLRTALEERPTVPSVACFDTMFHATMPDAARTYAVPQRWRAEHGIRHYGFHGMAHEWAAGRAAALLDRDPVDLRVVVAHLGSGASACAVDGGRSVDTTMGFTPTSGLVMATRSGDVDPSAVSWLIEHAGLSAADVDDALDRSCGLLALCGRSDMREVLDAADSGDEAAVLARDVYTHRVRAGVAAMAAAMGGLDVLAFSGGVGENAPEVRRRVVAGLGFLGLASDDPAGTRADAVVTADGAAVDTVVVASREELLIAREVRALCAARR